MGCHHVINATAFEVQTAFGRVSNLQLKYWQHQQKKYLFLNFCVDEEFLSFFSSKPFRSFLHVYPKIYFDIDYNKKSLKILLNSLFANLANLIMLLSIT